MDKPLFMKDPLEIIKEASLSDDTSGILDESSNELISSVLETYDGIETIPNDALQFGVDAVPVVPFGEGAYKKFLIDSDVLLKYMGSNKIQDVKEAVDNVLDYIKENQNVAINHYDVRLVVENKSDLIQSFTESKNNAENQPCNSYYKVKAGYDYYKNIYSSGIKMVQKQATMIPQQDTDSLMLGGDSHANITGNPFLNDDLQTQSMKGKGANTTFPDSEYLNDDLKTQSMIGQGPKTKIMNNSIFNNDDYVQGSMKGMDSNIGIKISDAPFTQDDDTNPMKGNSGSIHYPKTNDSLNNDDPNVNGMLNNHKGF